MDLRLTLEPGLDLLELGSSPPCILPFPRLLAVALATILLPWLKFFA